jgi:hypothetical protein
MSFPEKVIASAQSISRTFTWTHPCQILNMSMSKLQIKEINLSWNTTSWVEIAMVGFISKFA